MSKNTKPEENKKTIILPPGAVGHETIPHKYQFTDNELREKQISVIKNLNKIDSIDKEIKEFVDPKKHDIKMLGLQTASIRNELNMGFEMQERDCFLVPNHESGKMQYIDVETNEVLWERPLMSNERQLSISNAPARTGTEG